MICSISIDVDEHLWLDYRAFCLKNRLNMNAELEKALLDRMSK
tara:strand:+ start:460 stop:588 length:129 start_codon:yes stop_codon:yes gene_type:complete